MAPFDRLPNELFLAILKLLNTNSIIAFAQTCKHHYQVATDDATWLPVVLQFMAPHTFGQHLTPSLLQSRGSDLLSSITRTERIVSNPLFQIYSKHIVQYGWMLGWWFLTIDPAVGWRAKEHRLCRIHIDLRINEAGDLKYGILARIPLFPSVVLDPSLFINNPRLLAEQSQVGEALEISIPGASALSIEGHVGYGSEAIMGFVSPIGVVFDGSLEDYDGLNIIRIHPSFSPPEPPMNEIPSFSFDDPNQHFDDAPFPSPSLQSLFFDTRAILTSPLHPSPGDRLTWSVPEGATSASRIRSPTSFTNPTTDLLRSGIYLGPYGPHGWEYVLVQIRRLVDADFVDTWPWEGTFSSGPETRGTHLGPFASTFQGFSDGELRVAPNYVRTGARILEVVKITGDRNVPKGQRSILAFLDDPRAPNLNDLDLPEKPSAGSTEYPWPLARNHASQSQDDILQSEFSPSRGVDLPGCIRLASWGFARPQWDNCTVHIESRTQFSALIHSFNKVSVFTKIGDLVDSGNELDDRFSMTALFA